MPTISVFPTVRRNAGDYPTNAATVPAEGVDVVTLSAVMDEATLQDAANALAITAEGLPPGESDWANARNLGRTDWAGSGPCTDDRTGEVIPCPPPGITLHEVSRYYAGWQMRGRFVSNRRFTWGAQLTY